MKLAVTPKNTYHRISYRCTRFVVGILFFLSTVITTLRACTYLAWLVLWVFLTNLIFSPFACEYKINFAFVPLLCLLRKYHSNNYYLLFMHWKWSLSNVKIHFVCGDKYLFGNLLTQVLVISKQSELPLLYWISIDFNLKN